MTERDIQRLIIRERERALHVPNIFLYPWETDLLRINDDGTMIEYEIKTSYQDFKADFVNKEEKHHALDVGYSEAEIPNHFYFICPDGIIPKSEIPHYAGLIYVVKQGMNKYLKTVRKAEILTSQRIDSSMWQKIAKSLIRRQII